MIEQSSPAPDNYDGWYQQGNRQIDAGQYEEAINSFDQALEYNPDADDAWRGKGNALFYLERYDEAFTSYDQAANIQPNQYKIWWARGCALASLGQNEEAIADYDKALELQPNSHEVWVIRGKALDSLKRYKQSLASYEKALEIQREIGNRRAEAETLLLIIFAYTFNGKLNESFLAQQQAISIAKELNLSPEDPLYSLASHGSIIPAEQIPSFKSVGWMGKLMGFATRGKLQSILFLVVWLLFFVSQIVFFPVGILWWTFRRLTRRA